MANNFPRGRRIRYKPQCISVLASCLFKRARHSGFITYSIDLKTCRCMYYKVDLVENELRHADELYRCWVYSMKGFLIERGMTANCLMVFLYMVLMINVKCRIYWFVLFVLIYLLYTCNGQRILYDLL